MQNPYYRNRNSVSHPKYGQNSVSGRGTLILVFGILSIVLIGFGGVLGILAWVLGIQDLKKIEMGLISIAEKSKTQAGMIMGIIGTVLMGLGVIVVGIAVVVAVNISNSSSDLALRDTMSSESMQLGAMAQQYFRKPMEMGGGGNSFHGWDVPQKLQTTTSAKYSLQQADDFSVTIIGVGTELGTDGIRPVRSKCIVTKYEMHIEFEN